MNRIFKAVWNESTGTWVAASETSKSKTKRSSARKLVIAQAVMIGIGGLVAASGAHADDWAAPGTGIGSIIVGPNATITPDNAIGANSVAIGL
ncbi:MAG: trimeric autotransporter adhesin, partial [Caballeronia sp.]|nr:trimeric autotransporter adhesin [Caballeronia sp.]